jgi:hypothetical protein
MFRIVLAAAVVLCSVAPAMAQLTVVTDEATYVVGNVVEITIHNAGPSVVMFVGTPHFSITHVESGVTVYGETQVPDITYLPVGATEVFDFDTDAYPHDPGHYRIWLHVIESDPGSILEATYVLEAVVDDETTTWSGIKALYWP